ncbi:MAG TPA: magnesium/cobalt transporter CorA [Longimicrobiaceae bacterium]|nr:magnesium/cobalt transporter CorA [Longimicrobiaceae bacterium]
MRAQDAAPSIRCFEGGAGGLHEIDRAAATAGIRHALASLDEADRGFVWVEIAAPTETEAKYLRDELGMHHLAVEDCLRGRQRPKIDHYAGYSFLVYYATRLNPARSRVALNELHLFLGRGFLITVHSHEIPEIEEVIAACREAPARRSDSIAVAHALLDAITDRYFPLIEHFSNRIEGFEEQVFLEMPTTSMEKVADLRRELIHVRRVLAPQRDVVSLLVRRDLPFIRAELLPYFQDVHDHILRATEEVDTLRDLLTGLIDIYGSSSARQLNQTMRTLTAWSIILMTMGLVAGVYGMNFRRMPELEWGWGYAFALVLMLGLGGWLLRYFRTRQWL